MDDSDAATKAVRHRACMSCASAKRSCDGARPCYRCVSHGTPEACCSAPDKRTKEYAGLRKRVKTMASHHPDSHKPPQMVIKPSVSPAAASLVTPSPRVFATLREATNSNIMTHNPRGFGSMYPSASSMPAMQSMPEQHTGMMPRSAPAGLTSLADMVRIR
jgi:hypothetical protein